MPQSTIVNGATVKVGCRCLVEIHALLPVGTRLVVELLGHTILYCFIVYMPGYKCGGQRTTFVSLFSPSSMGSNLGSRAQTRASPTKQSWWPYL